MTKQLAQTCRLLRDHGQSKKYFHDIEGYNGRLDAIQAGFLRVKLRHLEKWNGAASERSRIATTNCFAGAEGGVTLPHQPEWSRAVYHLYVVRVADRAQLQKRLDAGGHRYGNPLSDSAASDESI